MLHLKTKHVNFPNMCRSKSFTPLPVTGLRWSQVTNHTSHMEAAHSRGGALHHHLHECTWNMETFGYLHAGLIFRNECNTNHMQLKSMI